MTPEEVAALMRTSQTNNEWGANCDKVKEAHGGDYPDFWWKTIIMSGLMNEVLGPGSDEPKIINLR